MFSTTSRLAAQTVAVGGPSCISLVLLPHNPVWVSYQQGGDWPATTDESFTIKDGRIIQNTAAQDKLCIMRQLGVA